MSADPHDPDAPAPPGRRSGAGAASAGIFLGQGLPEGAGMAGKPLELCDFTILVVDDTAAARYATARMLRHAGFLTLEAAAGAQALQLADRASAVVLDVHLPDILGFEVCRLLRANPGTAALPVIHVSARYMEPEDIAHGKSVGADAYLTAPYSPDLLTTTLLKLLTARGH